MPLGDVGFSITPVAARAKKSHLVAIVLNASEDDGANADTSSHHPMQQQTFFIFCRNHHSAVQTNLSVYSWLSPSSSVAMIADAMRKIDRW